MILKDLKKYIQMGREIEFNYKCHEFFIQPDYKLFPQIKNFILYDCLNPGNIQIICSGSYEEIIKHEIFAGICLETNLNMFSIDCIL